MPLPESKDTKTKDDMMSEEKSETTQSIIRRNIPFALHYQERAENTEGKPRKLIGYAAVFNKTFEQDWYGTTFREIIAPGAFKRALGDSDCRALFNHDANFPLARQSAGNLELKEDDVGLWMEAEPTNTSYARDLEVNIDAGVVKEQSFAFTIAKETWEEDNENDIVTRTITEVGELYDVSPVTYPAYKDTSVGTRQYRDIYDAWSEVSRQNDDEEIEERATNTTENPDESSTQMPEDSDSPQTPESRKDNQRRIRGFNMRQRKFKIKRYEK